MCYIYIYLKMLKIVILKLEVALTASQLKKQFHIILINMDYYIVVMVYVAILGLSANCRTWHGGYDHGYHKHHGFDHHRNWDSGSSGWDFPQHGHYPCKYFNHDNDEFWNNQDTESDSWSSDEDRSVSSDPVTRLITPSWTPTSPTAASATSSTLTIVLCMQSCPVTPEYNPVCGTNNVTYSNPGRLECARNCGIEVTLKRSSPCSRPRNMLADTSTSNNNNQTVGSNVGVAQSINNKSSTISPVNNDIEPTRYTTIDINSANANGLAIERSDRGESQPTGQIGNGDRRGFTIPADLLASVFKSP